MRCFRCRAGERGAQSLEFVALLPLVILTLLLMLQTALFGYTLVVAESATREAAVAASNELRPVRDWPEDKTVQLAAAEVAGGLHVDVTAVTCNRARVTVTAEARVPNLLFDSSMHLRRKVTMPMRDGVCP